MNDETMMAEEIGRLKEENRELKSALAGARHDLERAKVIRHSKSIMLASVALAPAIGFVLLLGYPIYKSFQSPTVVDHCRIEKEYVSSDEPRMFSLRGNIEWHDDINHGVFKTMDEAVAAAEKIKCPLRK